MASRCARSGLGQILGKNSSLNWTGTERKQPMPVICLVQDGFLIYSLEKPGAITPLSCHSQILADPEAPQFLPEVATDTALRDLPG